MNNKHELIKCAICGEELPRNKFYMNEHNELNPFCKDCNRITAHHRDKNFILDYLARRPAVVITDIEDKETRMLYIRQSVEKVKRRIELHRSRPQFKPFR